SSFTVSEKKGKKKSQTVTQPKPKSQVTVLGPKYLSQRYIGKTQPAVKGSPLAVPDEALITDQSETDMKYQVNKTQSTRFEVSVSDQNKGKTSSEVEPDTETLLLTTVANIQALLGDYKDELKDDSENEVFKAGEEMDEDIQEPNNVETHHAHSTKHQSPLPNKDKPESSKTKKTNTSDSKSSSLQYAHVTEDNWVKHKKAAASYADLRVAVEGYYEENVDHRAQTKTVLQNTMNLIDRINKHRVDERARLLKSLNIVSEILEVDSTLKATMQDMAETHNKTSSNLNELFSLIKNFDLPGSKSAVEALQSRIVLKMTTLPNGQVLHILG
ncbi:hypothetical protein Tco_1250576, partial [Tanacetum coccineum]